MDETLKQIRQALADYMRSEGCECCRDDAAHRIAEERLAKLLRVSKYKDGSGYDWVKHQTKAAK